jgi:hypothetical protein
MPMSEDKISHLSHLILRGLGPQAELRADETTVLREIKRVLQEEAQLEVELDRRVRAKLASYARPVPEGSTEWDVLYRKLLAEELQRHTPRS